jgi:hypothetical protein
MPTTVVHVLRDAYDIYIGRHDRFHRLSQSKWRNPYVVDKPGRPRDGTRAEVIAKYRAYLLASPELLTDLGSLKGQRLACWCSPLPCHGDVLAELAEQKGEDEAPF